MRRHHRVRIKTKAKKLVEDSSEQVFNREFLIRIILIHYFKEKINDFFSHIAQHFSDPSYADLYKSGNQQNTNSKEGGYVRLEFTEALKNIELRNETFPQLVHKTIVELLEQFDPNEICILVRKKKEGAAIAKYLTEQGVDIVSSETLLIKNNTKVHFIVSLLSMLEDDKNDEAKFDVLNFLYDHLGITFEKHQFLDELIHLETEVIFNELKSYGLDYNPQRFDEYSIFEGVEDMIRSFRLTTDSDAFLQFFMDFVFDYTQRRSQKNLGFLEFWEEKKDKLNITSSEEAKAIRIMTIHKSKGLEFPVVIFPYDMQIYGERTPVAWYKPLKGDYFKGFTSLLVSASSKIQLTGDRGVEIFDELQTEQELDSVNLLYVCLTRAVEQLYIISEVRKNTVPPKTTSDLLSGYLKSCGLWQDGKSLYSLGSKQRASSKGGKRSHSLVQKELISSSWMDHDLHLVSKASELWDTRQGEAITFGNRFHEIMAFVNDKEDLEPVIESSIASGQLESSERERIMALMRSLVEHPELKDQFEPGLEVMNERQIFVSEGIAIIPDRLVFRDNRVWITDYKTGAQEPKHGRQINQYALVMQEMGYDVAERLLVYVNGNVKVIKIDSKIEL